MGQIINFGKKSSYNTNTNDLISLLPKLRPFKEETIVIRVCQEAITDTELLNDIAREIVTLKYMDCDVVVVPNSNPTIEQYCSDTYGIANPFEKENFISNVDIINVIEAIIKRDILTPLALAINKCGGIALPVSGRDLSIFFAEDAITKNDDLFNSSNPKSISENILTRNQKQSVDALNELRNTALIPILSPSFRDKQYNEYILESNLFAMQIAKNLNALKLVMTYTDMPIIPTNSIYGIDRFTKIIKKNDIDGEPLSMFYASIEAVRSGVQGVNFVDINQTSFLEEICSSAPSGLFLYDDLLGQL